jgi:hypothetical protein
VMPLGFGRRAQLGQRGQRRPAGLLPGMCGLLVLLGCAVGRKLGRGAGEGTRWRRRCGKWGRSTAGGMEKSISVMGFIPVGARAQRAPMVILNAHALLGHVAPIRWHRRQGEAWTRAVSKWWRWRCLGAPALSRFPRGVAAWATTRARWGGCRVGLWRDVGRMEERGLDVANWATWSAGPRKGKSQLGLAG